MKECALQSKIIDESGVESHETEDAGMMRKAAPQVLRCKFGSLLLRPEMTTEQMTRKHVTGNQLGIEL
mgnify:CR=1 FL=1